MQSAGNNVVIRHRGVIYRVRKAPFETEERAHDRAWHIAKRMASKEPGTRVNEHATLVCESHMWANEKYFNMKYK